MEVSKIVDLLSGIYGKSKDDITALVAKKEQDKVTLKDNWIDAIKTLDAEKVASSKTELDRVKTEKFEQGFKAGELKKAKTIEKLLEGIDGATVDERIEALKKKTGGKKIENVKETEEYKALQLSIDAKIKEIEKVKASEVAALKAQLAELKMQTSLTPKIATMFDSLNIVTSPQLKQNQLNVITTLVKQSGITFKDGKTFKGEQLVVDEHNIPISQDKWLEQVITSTFPVAQSTGGSGQQGGSGSQTNFDFSGKEGLAKYSAYVNDPANSDENKLKAKEAFKAQRES